MHLSWVSLERSIEIGVKYMEKSEEIKNLILKAAKAYEQGDADFWVNIVAQQEDALVIGSSPNEVFKGYDTIVKMLKEDWGAKKPFTVTMLDIQAFSEGTVGWYVVKSIYKYDNGSELPLRINGVMHKENGVWKLLLQNFTLEVPNDKMGKVLDKWNF